jgi:hypothetical protein
MGFATMTKGENAGFQQQQGSQPGMMFKTLCHD